MMRFNRCVGDFLDFLANRKRRRRPLWEGDGSSAAGAPEWRRRRSPRGAGWHSRLGLSELRSALFQPLEERLMLDIGGANSLPPTIVVGRTLSAYDVPDVKNNQETLTLTVYNQAASAISGVLLTDTLESGVTLASASQLPDQNGQELAWGLGTIQPFDRASVTLTVSLGSTMPTQVDAGASAYGTLDGGMVTWTTAPATLRTTAIAADLLASTPDANTTDPYVQEKAAELNYDPTQIFNFLQTQIGYNSYLGSVRGARGTLWSSAGNALDDASLGVALMRASGIPAQYVSGTLSKADAQQLILSMFPASYQTAGVIPAGTPTADPANDSQLLSETESHDWFQFDSGGGMKDADPLMAGATVGQAFTTAASTFAEVPDSLREKTEVQLTAEVYSQGAAQLGIGDGLSQAVVLDQTFNDVDLVGHPLTVGNLVTSTGGGLTIGETVNTYTPYLAVGDAANPDPAQDQIITGQSFQDVFTNFPLASQVVTGLFMNVTLSGPQGAGQTYDKTLYDAIGYAARQGDAPVTVSLSASSQPSLSPFEVWSMSVLAGLDDPNASLIDEQGIQDVDTRLNAALAAKNDAGVTSAITQVMIGQSRGNLDALLTATGGLTAALADRALVVAYSDRPRIILVSGDLAADGSNTTTLSLESDLLDDSVRVLGYPGQAASAVVTFRFARGVEENVTEAQIFAQPTAVGSVTVKGEISTSTVMDTAAAQGIPLVTLTPSDPAALDNLTLNADAKARITTALDLGLTVIVPSGEVTIGGTKTVAWWQLNPQTGELTGVAQDGSHNAFVEYAASLVIDALTAVGIAYGLGYLAGTDVFNVALDPAYNTFYAAAMLPIESVNFFTGQVT
ncbi:MAG TPA: transglutaminase domain-containing protein, partial [Pirellulales bacterium]|nr:transglutaminase domain-containing protein [Pirellulales bacterium]